MTNFDYDAHIKNEQIKANLTPEQLQELKDLYVERLVDNMSTKDLVAYVTDDMTDYVDKQSPLEFFDDAYSYFDDYFDEIVEEIKGGQSVNDLD
jgi:ABC-type enterochelin transport system ATPase subunit